MADAPSEPSAHTGAASRRPPAGTWLLDPRRSSVTFVGRHIGLSTVRGRFGDVSGVVVIAEDLARSSVDIAIGMASLDSGDRRRDDRLRAPRLLDVASYPAATFHSTTLAVSDDAGALTGDLTIKSTARPVTLHVRYLGLSASPHGPDHAVFTAAGRLRRADWQLGWNVLLEAGGLVVAKHVRLEIHGELVRAG